MNETNEFRGERLKVKWLYVLILFFYAFSADCGSRYKKNGERGE